MSKILATIILIFGIQLGLNAQNNIKSNWKANWITNDETTHLANSWTIYRKKVDLSSKPTENVIASIATDSKYWLYVNGALVVFEGQLKRGPTPQDTYYDQVDLTKHLKAGENTIAILVWFWGQEGFCHKNSGATGLLFEADLGTKMLLSDTSWKVARHSAFGVTKAPFPNYRLPEYNIHFDAQKDIIGWETAKFKDDAWKNANIIAKAGDGPWNKLWLRPIPLWKNSGIVKYENHASWPEVSDGTIITMKLPRNLAVTPYLKIEAPADQVIDIRTDNYKGGSEYNVRTEYVTKHGVQEFETPGYMNGHEVQYNIPKNIRIIELKYRVTGYNHEFTGSFTSSDNDLNKLWVKSLNTMDINMRDAIQDPDRERAQWWGDVVIILGQIFYSTDSNGIKAISKSMSNLVEWQRNDSVLFSPIPAGKWDKELPAQMLASVGKYGFYKYFEYTNDTAMIRNVYPHVRKYLELWNMDKNGLLIHREGGWDWHDWGERVDAPLLDNAWYYMALDGASLMADIAGDTERGMEYRNKMGILKKAFNKNFWNGRFYKSADYRFVADDRGNGLAVVAGLADGQQWKGMVKMLDTTFNSGPYLEKYVQEGYFKMGDAQKGKERMLSRYKAMIESPVSTLWEGWQVGSETYGGGSYNHGWSGGPLTLMSQYITGLSPDGPGYQNINVIPNPSGLEFAKMSTYTVAGQMEVEFSQQKKIFKLNIKTPMGKQMNVGMPVLAKPYRQIRLNGKVIWENDAPTAEGNENFKSKDNHHLMFRVNSGEVKFTGLLK